MRTDTFIAIMVAEKTNKPTVFLQNQSSCGLSNPDKFPIHNLCSTDRNKSQNPNTNTNTTKNGSITQPSPLHLTPRTHQRRQQLQLRHPKRAGPPPHLPVSELRPPRHLRCRLRQPPPTRRRQARPLARALRLPRAPHGL